MSEMEWWWGSRFLEPVQICPDKAVLRDVLDSLRKGHLVVVNLEGTWYLLSGTRTAGYPPTRRLVDLPLVKLPLISPSLSPAEAYKKIASSEAEYGLVIEEETVLGALSSQRVVEAMVEEVHWAAQLGQLFSETLRNAGVVLWRLPLPRGKLSFDKLSLSEAEAFGDVQRLFGLPEDKARGFLQVWFDHLSPGDQYQWKKQVHKVLTEGGSAAREYQFSHPKGRSLWIRERIWVEQDAGGDPIALLGVAYDITTEAEKRQRQSLLERIYRVLSQRSPGEILEKALEVLGQALPIDEARVCIIGPGSQLLFVSGWVRKSLEGEVSMVDKALSQILALPASRKERELSQKLWAALEKGKVIYLSNLTEFLDPGCQLLAQSGFCCLSLMPLLTEDDRRIVLAALGKETVPSEEQRELFEDLRPTFAAVIRAWQYEESLKKQASTMEEQVRQRTYELQILYELAQQLGYALNYDEIFRLMVEYLHRVMDYDVAGWLLVPLEELVIHPSRPFSPKLQAEIQRRLLRSFHQLSGKTVLKPHLRVESPPDGRPQLERLGSTFQVPLVIGAQREVVGLLFIGAERKEAFSQEQIRLLYTVANQASVSVERLHSLLQAERRQMETIFNTVPEGLILLDRERRLALANPAAQRYLAWLGKLLPGEVLESLGGIPIEELLRPPASGGWHEIELSEPERRVFQVSSAPIEAGPEARGWVLALREVTQERAMQEKMEEQARLAAVGQLAAGIAHDFNNLLTPIIGYAELLCRRGDLPEDARNASRVIQEQGERAAQLIQQILDFTRRSVREKVKLDLVPYLKEAARLLERTLRENIRVKLSLEPGSYFVEADPTGLQQVITNLAVNAQDAMPQGGDFHISISRFRLRKGDRPPLPEMPPGEWLVLKFADTGVGIKPEHLPHIFEPFFTTKQRGRGTGLGLSQVYGIIKQHNGFIAVESRLGEGTTFTVYLPALASAREAPAAEERGKPEAVGRGETILVVEDNEVVRQTISAVLREAGYRVVEASSGGQALELSKELGDQLALLITDWVMPGMNGLELLRRLRRESSVKVLVISGYPLDMKPAELSELGVAGWVSKPVKSAELCSWVAKALGNHKE